MTRINRVCWVLLTALLLIACAEAQQPKSKPTAAPSLTVNLWMTYPAVQPQQTQSANLVVYNGQGQPVSGATGILIVAVGDYKREYHFPLTNTEGRASVTVEIPNSPGDQSVMARVVVIQSDSGEWGEAVTEFAVMP